MSIYRQDDQKIGTFIYLPASWIKELKRLAVEENVSYSQIIRKALRHFFNLDKLP